MRFPNPYIYGFMPYKQPPWNNYQLFTTIQQHQYKQNTLAICALYLFLFLFRTPVTLTNIYQPTTTTILTTFTTTIIKHTGYHFHDISIITSTEHHLDHTLITHPIFINQLSQYVLTLKIIYQTISTNLLMTFTNTILQRTGQYFDHTHITKRSGHNFAHTRITQPITTNQIPYDNIPQTSSVGMLYIITNSIIIVRTPSSARLPTIYISKTLFPICQSTYIQQQCVYSPTSSIEHPSIAFYLYNHIVFPGLLRNYTNRNTISPILQTRDISVSIIFYPTTNGLPHSITHSIIVLCPTIHLFSTKKFHEKLQLDSFIYKNCL